MIARAHLRHVSLLLFGCFALALAGCPGGGGGGNVNGNDNTGNTNENDNTDGNTNENENDNTDGNVNENENENDNVAEPDVLFVVNNNDGITSYVDPQSLDGDVAPATALPAGGVTGIFQPRSIAVTDSGVLLISSQSDAIVGYEDAFTATGEVLVDRTIEGTATLLNVPISFAYDGERDILYVGNAGADDGILVFENVSLAAFDGDVAPARMFGPTDRSPFNPDVSVTSTIDAMSLDANGNLFVSDTSGLNVNQSRILVFDSPQTADGATEVAQIFTSTAWGQIEDIFVDDSNVLYVVDGEDRVVIVNDATTLVGDIDASDMFTVQADLPQLHGIVVDRDGTGFVADSGNFAIYSFSNIADLTGTVAPERSIEGNATELRTPRQLFLFEPEVP